MQQDVRAVQALLNRAGVSDSSFYSATHRESPIPSKNREKIRRALLDTAAALEAIAHELSRDDGELAVRKRNTRYDVVHLAARQTKEHGVRTRMDL